MSINARRLLKLADYLETVPRRRFHMATFGWGRNNECGFSGCAIGWAIHGKLFKGFTFANNDNPKFAGKEWYPAVEELFGTDEDNTMALFGPQNKGTPHQVATRIRKFVRANQGTAS